MRTEKEVYIIPEIKVVRFTEEIVFASGCTGGDCNTQGCEVPDCSPECPTNCNSDVCFST